jgi:hypothetical protein
MLTNTLNTNEIMNASGTENEFSRLSIDGRTTVFHCSGGANAETPQYPHRLTISHEETGNGNTRRRRSVVRFDRTTDAAGDVLPTGAKSSCYIVMDSPIGALSNNDVMLGLLAQLGSFMFTTGTNTFLYNGTGTGTAATIAGGL